MAIRDEIRLYAKDADRPALDWLFGRYHWESQWRFVAFCTLERYGVESYAVNRVWAPTPEGRVLYESGKL